MRRPEFIARQAGHPTGLLGRLLARIMAIETVTVNRRVLELLELEDASKVLEVGLIDVKRASSDQIPYPDESFDRVYAAHTLYFWNDPLAHLRETHRVCRVGGRFILAFGPKEDRHAVAAFPESVYHFYSIGETQKLLADAGFIEIQMIRERIASRDIVFAVGRR